MPLFFVAILFATFFGGAIRSFFSPRQIEQWVGQTLEKENPDFDLNFSTTSLSLADGWIPRLGLIFHDLRVASKKPCVFNALLQIDQLYLPIDVFALMEGRLRFRVIEIDRAQWASLPKLCPSPSAEANAPTQGVGTPLANFSESSADAIADTLKRVIDPLAEMENAFEVPPAEDPFFPHRDPPAPPAVNLEKLTRFQPLSAATVESIRTFLVNRWSKEMKNTFQLLKGLHIRHLELRSTPGPRQKVTFFKNVRLNTNNPRKFVLTGQITDPVWQATSGSSTAAQLRVVVDEKMLLLNLTQQIREGLLRLRGRVQFPSLKYRVWNQMHHLPTKNFFDQLVKGGGSRVLQWDRQNWLSGDVLMQGRLDDWASSKLALKNLQVKGDLGHVSVGDVEVRPFGPDYRETPFSVKFHSLEVDALVKMFRLESHRGMLQELGHFSGEGVGSFAGNFELKGRCSDLILKFSSRGVRESQRFGFDIDIRKEKDSWSALVNQVDIENGSFIGEVSGQYSDQEKKGRVQSSIQKLTFSPSIQRLMLNANATPMEIYGQGKIEKGKMANAELAVGTQSLQGEHWQLSQVKMKIGLANESWQIKAGARELAFEKNHPYFADLQRLYLGRTSGGSSLKLSALSAQISYEHPQLKWQRGYAMDEKNRVTLSSEGAAERGVMKGWINVDLPALKMLRWNVAGTWPRPRVSPSEKLLKDLERRSPELLRALKTSEDLSSKQ